MPRPASVLLVALACACGPAVAGLQVQQGEAHAADGGNLLYREQHLIRRDGDRIRERLVLYRCTDGTAFARKHVKYDASRFAPDFSLTDARDGYREGLGHTAGGHQVWSGISAQPETLAKDDGALVADAGFDEFVRAHWAQLQDGKLPIRFVVPAYDRSLDFNVRGLGQSTIDGEAVQRFSLKLGGMLSLVSPQIEVDYGAVDHRLRRFKGISNLRSDRGKAVDGADRFSAAGNSSRRLAMAGDAGPAVAGLQGGRLSAIFARAHENCHSREGGDDELEARSRLA